MADSCVACKGLLKPPVPTVLNAYGLTCVTPCTTLAGAVCAALVPLPRPDSTMKNTTISATETSVAMIDVLPCHQGRVVSRRRGGLPTRAVRVFVAGAVRPFAAGAARVFVAGAVRSGRSFAAVAPVPAGAARVLAPADRAPLPVVVAVCRCNRFGFAIIRPLAGHRAAPGVCMVAPPVKGRDAYWAGDAADASALPAWSISERAAGSTSSPAAMRSARSCSPTHLKNTALSAMTYGILLGSHMMRPPSC